jgi:hypothetical protein
MCQVTGHIEKAGVGNTRPPTPGRPTGLPAQADFRRSLLAIRKPVVEGFNTQRTLPLAIPSSYQPVLGSSVTEGMETKTVRKL